MGGDHLKNEKPQGWEEKLWSTLKKKKKKTAQLIHVGRS